VLLKQGLVKREYALRGDAPPHYRYKTVSVEEFEEKTILAAEEFTEKVKEELGRN
jgi:predicted transcriptional regulator